MIRAVLADDEVLARQKLRQLLRDEQDIEIAGECASAAETIELVSATAPDLLFLDIRMPDMDGFDVLGALAALQSSAMPEVIFTTAFDRYAVRAFEFNAVDYLLKPFTAERLRAAIQHFHQRVSSAHPSKGEAAPPPERERYAARMVFKSRGRILFLPVEEIRWISAEENYVRICTGGDSHLLRDTMARLEARLNPDTFLRIHRSSIVNLHYVKEVRSEPDGESTVVLISGEKIALSRSYRANIQKLMRA